MWNIYDKVICVLTFVGVTWWGYGFSQAISTHVYAQLFSLQSYFNIIGIQEKKTNTISYSCWSQILYQKIQIFEAYLWVLWTIIYHSIISCCHCCPYGTDDTNKHYDRKHKIYRFYHLSIVFSTKLRWLAVGIPSSCVCLNTIRKP